MYIVRFRVHWRLLQRLKQHYNIQHRLYRPDDGLRIGEIQKEFNQLQVPNIILLSISRWSCTKTTLCHFMKSTKITSFDRF